MDSVEDATDSYPPADTRYSCSTFATETETHNVDEPAYVGLQLGATVSCNHETLVRVTNSFVHSGPLGNGTGTTQCNDGGFGTATLNWTSRYFACGERGSQNLYPGYDFQHDLPDIGGTVHKQAEVTYVVTYQHDCR